MKVGLPSYGDSRGRKEWESHCYNYSFNYSKYAPVCWRKQVPMAAPPSDTAPPVPPENAVRAVSHAVRNKPAPKEECALEIIKSGALRQRELYYPTRLMSNLMLLRAIAPDFLDSRIRGNYKVENIKRP